MASNAKFEIEIYGNTAKFENSLKGINTAMSGLRNEASGLRKALKLDPTNTDNMARLQKNLQQQLSISKDRAAKLKQELATVDKSTPAGQKRWIQLTRQLQDAETGASKLESEIKDVGEAISRGSWDVKAKVDLDDGSVNSKIDGFKSRFNGLREIAIGAFRQIGSSAVSALGNGLRGWVSDAMATQKAMISLKNTMEFKGNAQEFNMVSKSMSKLAADTNANTEDTLKLSTTFVGLGDDAKTAVSKTEALVKANQAFGGTGENLKGVVQAYGQMSAAGKVTAENINQLTDNNTALGSALKSTVMEMNPALKQYSSFAEASEDGAISVEMLDKAMQKLGKAGGGAVTTIGDAWDSFNETVSLALLPTLDALTPVIASLIDKMSVWGESAGKAVENVVKWVMTLWEELKVSGTLTEFGRVWENIKSILGSVGAIILNVAKSFLPLEKAPKDSADAIGDTMEILWALAESMQKSTAKIAAFVKKISESETAMHVLKGALVVLASAFAAFKVSKGILATINAFKTIGTVAKMAMGSVKALFGLMLANPFVAIAVAIAAVVAGLVYFFTQTEKGKKVWADFVKFLQQSVENIKNFFSGLGNWFANLWQGIVDTTKSIGQDIANSWNESVQSIKNIWNGVVQFFVGIVEGIKGVWQGITEFFVGLWNGIVTTVQNVATTISGIVTGIYNWFVTTFQPLISFYQSIFSLVVSVINLAFQTVMAIVRAAYQAVLNAWQGLSAWFGGIFNVVSNVVKSAFNAVIGFAKWAWNGLVGIWNAVAGFFGGIFNAVKNVVQAAFNAVASFASSAWNRLVGVWNAVSGFFGGIFSSVQGVVSSVFNAVGNFASNAWNRITGVFSGIGSWFGGVFSSVSGAVSGVFSAFGSWASGAYNAITGVFSGIGQFFSNIFNGIKQTIDNALGGITGVIDNISGAINGIAGKVSGLFKGSLVANLPDVNMKALGSTGLVQNSVSGDRTTNNTFNIQASGNATDIARAVRREFERGRA